MLLQPCLRAQSSAATSSHAPAPKLRCPSATTNPFTSARISTSRSGCLLTCTQPITPSLPDSATNTACCEAGLIPSSLLRICAVVAGSSLPHASFALSFLLLCDSSARSASLRYRFSSLIFPTLGPFAPQSCLHGGTLQFAQRVRGNPAGGAGTLQKDSLRGADRFPVEPLISFPDVSQGPVDRFLHKISLIVRFALDDSQESHELRIRGRFIFVTKIRNQGKAGTLHELFAVPAPSGCLVPCRLCKSVEITARGIDHVPGIEISCPLIHLGQRDFFGLTNQCRKDFRFMNTSRPKLLGNPMILANLFRELVQHGRGDAVRLRHMHTKARHLRAHLRIRRPSKFAQDGCLGPRGVVLLNAALPKRFFRSRGGL